MRVYAGHFVLFGSLITHVIHPKPYKKGAWGPERLSQPQAPSWQLWVGDGSHFRLWGEGCNGNNCKSGKVDTNLKRNQISQQLSV